MPSRRFNNKERQLVIDSYRKGCIGRQLAKKFGVTTTCIYNLLEEAGVKRTGTSRKYFFDEDFFARIDTERKAYWLGLFFADGCVCNSSFSLGFKRSERYILEALAKDVGYTGEIKDYRETKSIKDRPPKVYLSSRLTLCSKTFCNHLIDKGVIEGKTFRLKFPLNLDKSLYVHFIRGLFDGDGTICVRPRKDATRRNLHTQIFAICGHKPLLERVSAIICKYLKLEPKKLYQRDKIHVLQYAGLDDLIKIKEWLYSPDADLFFTRKHNMFSKVQPLEELPGKSLDEVSAQLGVARYNLEKYITEGHIPIFHEGRFVRLSESEFEKLKLLFVETNRGLGSSFSPWDKRKTRTGQNNQAAKLTSDMVREARLLHKQGLTFKNLADQFGVTDVTIRSAVLGITWSSVK